MQGLRLWVMELVAWMAGISGWRSLRIQAQADIRQLRQELRKLLVIRIGIEMRAGRLTPKFRRLGKNNPDLDRRLPHRRFMRFMLRGVIIRSIADARRVLDRTDAYVARCARNLRDGVAERGCWWARVAAAPVASIAHAADAPDTS